MALPLTPEKVEITVSIQPRLVGKTTLWIGPKSKADLADEYNKGRNTIARWCKAIGIEGKARLSLAQVLAFYRHYGYPGNYEVQLGLE